MDKEKIISSFDNLSVAALMYLESSFDHLDSTMHKISIDAMIHDKVYNNLNFSLDDDELMENYELLLIDPILYMRSSASVMTNVTFDEIKRRRALAIIELKN